MHDADTPVVHEGVTPVLTCDLWEHAYYLDHKNDRKGFLEAWFDRLANWRRPTARARDSATPRRSPE
jgi:Fe-Mn family superoxide dismutase